jgi:membrane-bound lytic murein transglycosylase A
MTRPILRCAGAVLLVALLASCGAPVVRQPPQPTTTRPVPPIAPPQPAYREIAWAALPGWNRDRAAEAWPAFLAGCATLSSRTDWADACAAARTLPAAPGDAAVRAFFESRFRAWAIGAASAPGGFDDTGLITSYYEPVLRGSRTRSTVYRTPLYRVPDDLLVVDLGDLYPALKGERVRGRLEGRRVVPYPDRTALADPKRLAGQELVFVDSELDAFFLQIQGSGRVRLPDGTMIRLAYADVNGHPYRAIGRYLVERGELTAEQVAGPALRQWLEAHPQRLPEVLGSNPSVVFFREEKIADPVQGPRGSLGVPLVGGRSIAVDPRLLPLGAPMFLATTTPDGTELARLVLAQDTGGAIRGVVRADLFWGSGPEAGAQAARMRQPGRLWLLWPRDRPLPAPTLPAMPAAAAPSAAARP